MVERKGKGKEPVTDGFHAKARFFSYDAVMQTDACALWDTRHGKLRSLEALM